jgi:GNAT superfamily N-acetyltransferase
MASIDILRPDRFVSASRLLAEAFFDNPAHTYICPDPDLRHSQLRWLLGGNLARQPDLSKSFCLLDGEEVQAMGFWTGSCEPKPGTVAKLNAGLSKAQFRLGQVGMRRLAEVTQGIDAQLREVLGKRPYWYLNNMVVAEHLRGSGLGSDLLHQQLVQLEREESAMTAALATQRPQNLAFYKRFGFEPALERTIGTGAEAFTNWVMVRPDAC